MCWLEAGIIVEEGIGLRLLAITSEGAFLLRMVFPQEAISLPRASNAGIAARTTQ